MIVIQKTAFYCVVMNKIYAQLFLQLVYAALAQIHYAVHNVVLMASAEQRSSVKESVKLHMYLYDLYL